MQTTPAYVVILLKVDAVKALAQILKLRVFFFVVIGGHVIDHGLHMRRRHSAIRGRVYHPLPSLAL